MSVELNKKIQNAGLPSYVFSTTLEKEGYGSIREIIREKEFRSADGRFVNYVIEPVRKSSKAARAAAVMGKELVLSGVGVLHLGLGGLSLELRERYAAYQPLADFAGGYLIVPDFADGVNFGPSMYREMQEMILNHISMGGGVILALPDQRKSVDLSAQSHFIEVLKTFTTIAVAA